MICDALIGAGCGELPKGMLNSISYRSTIAPICWALLLIGAAQVSCPAILLANDFTARRLGVSREPSAMGRLEEVLAQSLRTL